MAKFALLIGSGDYEHPQDFNPLETAARNVAALKTLFEDPEIGGFDEVKVLTHPTKGEMEIEIAMLFSMERRKDDVVLFYFAGHGFKDDRGRLYFAALNSQQSLPSATMLPTQWVHQRMDECRAKRQIVMLDCCFSGAFDPNLQAMSSKTVDLSQVVGTSGAEGRVAFASSSGLEYSFEREGMDLSIYTRFLVEGIKTGAGDLDEDGAIRADELHDYVSQRVKEAEPRMQPKIIVLKDQGYEVVISKAKPTDPKLQYRRAVQKYAATGKIRPAARGMLDVLRRELNLSAEVAKQIEFEFLRPFREHEENLRNYRNALNAEMKHYFPLEQDAIDYLKDLQLKLNLNNDEVNNIFFELQKEIKIHSKLTENYFPINNALSKSHVVPDKKILPDSAIYYSCLAFYIVIWIVSTITISTLLSFLIIIINEMLFVDNPWSSSLIFWLFFVGTGLFFDQIRKFYKNKINFFIGSLLSFCLIRILYSIFPKNSDMTVIFVIFSFLLIGVLLFFDLRHDFHKGMTKKGIK